LQQFGQVLGLRQALAQEDAQRQAQAQAAEIQRMMQATGGDPEKAMAALIQSGNVAAAAKLAPIVEQRRKANAPHVLAPGAQLVSPQGGIIASAPTKPDAEPEIVRLQKYLTGLPAGDPRRVPVERRIQMLGEKQGGVNVYSGSLTPAIDDQGNPIMVQPSGRADVPPRIVPGIRPAPKGAAELGLTPENAGKVAMATQAIEGVDVARSKIFDKDGKINKGLLLAISVPGTTGLPGHSDARIARSAIRNAVEAKLRLETGAAATESEINRTLDRFMPTVADTAESAKFKLDELQKFFRSSLSQTKGMKVNKPTEGNDPLGLR